MSVSVVSSALGKGPGSEVTKKIATSLFSDGDMHTYGMPVLLEYAHAHAPYRTRSPLQCSGKARKAAQFERGDIVSVQLGTRSNTNSPQSGPGWSRYFPGGLPSSSRTTLIAFTLNTTRAIEAADQLNGLWQPAAVASGQLDVHPYVIFFKNGRMVHHPVVRISPLACVCVRCVRRCVRRVRCHS
jgi:hypothetical protein